MNRIIKHTLLGLAATLIIVACNPSPQNQTPSASSLPDTSTRDNGEAKPEIATLTPDSLSGDTRSFLISAHDELGLQANVAKVALENSSTEAIKNLGKTIVDQSTELNNKLQSIASLKEVLLPAQMNARQRALEVFQDKKGKDFDNLFLDWVITASQNNIEKYEAGSKQIEDKEIGQFAVNALSIFKQHHDAARALKSK